MNWDELVRTVQANTADPDEEEAIIEAIKKYRKSFERATVTGAVNAILEEFDMMGEKDA